MGCESVCFLSRTQDVTAPEKSVQMTAGNLPKNASVHPHLGRPYKVAAKQLMLTG